MHLPGPSRSGSGTQVVLRGADLVTVRCGLVQQSQEGLTGLEVPDSFQMPGNYVGCWVGAQLPEHLCIDWAFHKKLVSLSGSIPREQEVKVIRLIKGNLQNWQC